MTNYQAMRDALHETEKMAKDGQGRATRELSHSVLDKLSKEDRRKWEIIAQNRTLSIQSDRGMVEAMTEHATERTRHFLWYIDQAIASGVLVQGDSLRQKLNNCENEKRNLIEERDKLDEEVNRVSTELISVRALYEECKKRSSGIQPATDT